MVGFVFLFTIVPATVGWAIALLRSRDERRLTLRMQPHLSVVVTSSLMFLPLFILGLLVCNFDYVSQRVPLWVQRQGGFLTVASVASLITLLAIYSSTIAQLSRHPKRHSVLFVAVLLSMVGPISYFQVHRPIAEALSDRRTADGVILQSSDSSCSAAALANIARFFGDEVTERDVAKLLGTTAFGTSPGQMRYAFEKLQIEYEMLDGQVTDLQAVTIPALLFVDHPEAGREGHSVAYFGECDEGYEIWDPLSGKGCWSEERIRRVWHGNGVECWRSKSVKPTGDSSAKDSDQKSP